MRRVRVWLVSWERLSRRMNGLNTNPVHPSHPFEWPERPEVQVAQDLAALDRSPVVTEIYLLLGVLGSESSTRTGWRNASGPTTTTASAPSPTAGAHIRRRAGDSRAKLGLQLA